MSNQNRRPRNKDGSIPKCLVCGKDAIKHINRRRWHDTCGNKKECSNYLRLSKMQVTKSAPEFAKVARKAALKTAVIKRNTIIDGQTLMMRTAAKIRAANLLIDETGLSGYEKASRKAVSKVRESNEKNGCWIPVEQQSAHRQYELAHRAATRKFDLTVLNNYDLRGPGGVQGAFHIDHKFSVHAGFIHNIPPEIIGHICNLEMKPWRENLIKSRRCDITIDDLLEAIKQYERDMK